jgi:uncharacterized protein YgiM (DUF1202 family)
MTNMKGLSGLLQFFIGFILGVALFVGGISVAGYVMFNRFAASPEKPLFPEEQPKPEVPKTDNQPSGGEKKPEEKKPETSPPAEAPLPAGAYKAKVVWSGGLNVRTEADRASDSIATLNYNDEVVVLSTEGEWSKLRVGEGTEGWVRSGNLEKLPASE